VLRLTGDWQQHKGGVYRCIVYLTLEAEGGFSVESANLPGVASQGETEEEALANIKEAFEGCFESYKAHGEAIPWLTPPREPEPGALQRVVIVHG
jgi:predicted RNase H-like HicB family nuclease